jgi:glycosyltransferase involved in cell wall biosynthesis
MVSRDVPPEARLGVQVLGDLSDEDLAERYRQAWIFCLPSSYEGFGIPYAEALTSGLPVIASPNVGARYVTAEGVYGLLASDADLPEAIIALLHDRSRRDELRRLGLERAAEFSLSRVAESYEELYYATLADRR